MTLRRRVGAILALATSLIVVAPAGAAQLAEPTADRTKCAALIEASTSKASNSTVVRSGCFQTTDQARMYVETGSPLTVGRKAIKASTYIGVAFTGSHRTGASLEFFGTSGTCAGGTTYAFVLTGSWNNNVDSALTAIAACLNSRYYNNANYTGDLGRCYLPAGASEQTCAHFIPFPLDVNRASSVRFSNS